jgi:uncharacterized membrane protein YeiB
MARAASPADRGYDLVELSARRPGPDVVRALAMAGVVVMNYHGYLILRGARRGGGIADDLFDPWTGPLSTRFAATFVLTAGVGVTLMTASSIGDSARTVEMRWRLVRRGVVLYAGGLLFEFIWPGTILPFYGAMFVLAALLFTLRSRWVLAVGAVAALAGWLTRWWRFERELDGHDTTWLTNPGSRSPRGLLFDLFVNGTHPLLPWLAFFCAGIVLGRVLTLPQWRAVVAGTGITLSAVAAIVTTSAGTGRRPHLVLSDDPFDRGIVYTASALGTALLAFAAISWIADRFERTPIVDVLRRAGQMSLTIYIAHALVFNLLVDWLDLLRPGSLVTAVSAATTFWLAATALAVAYQRRFGRGPVELLYRRLTA